MQKQNHLYCTSSSHYSQNCYCNCIAETPTKVPLVNDTILRTTEKLSSYVTDQAREHFDAQEDQLSLLWALQVHESTENVGKTNFIAYIGFIENIKCLKL